MSKRPKGQHQQQATSGGADPAPKRPWWLFRQEPIVGFTGWVAIFTGLLLLIGFFQFVSFIQSERSFLSTVGNFGFEDIFIEAKKQLNIVWSIKNSGKMTAITDQVNLTIIVLGPQGKELPPTPDYRAGRTDITLADIPGGDIYPTVVRVQSASSGNEDGFTEFQVASIKAKTSYLYFLATSIITTGFGRFGTDGTHSAFSTTLTELQFLASACFAFARTPHIADNKISDP
jgi:hypothetical protein